MHQKKPKVFKAIMTALLSLLIFGVVYFLSYLIVGGIIALLLKIPVIDTLLGWLFRLRGDTPDMMLSMLSPILAYYCTMATQESINKDKPTRGLSCVLLGIVIVVLHIFSIISNLLLGEGILKNIIQAIAGIVIFNSGKGELRESKDQEMPNLNIGPDARVNWRD